MTCVVIHMLCLMAWQYCIDIAISKGFQYGYGIPFITEAINGTP